MVYKKKAEEGSVATLEKEEIVEQSVTKKEKWAKARFSYIEMQDFPGATWSVTPNGKRENFKDGEIYERPLELFQMLNNECREVKRKLVKRRDDEMGTYVKTNQFNRRIWFEILETYEKEIPEVTN
jgi:hypothetical protein